MHKNKEHNLVPNVFVPKLTFSVPKLTCTDIDIQCSEIGCTKKKTYQKCMYQTCHVPKVTYLNLCLGISLLFVSAPVVKTRRLLTFPDNSGSISYWQYSHPYSEIGCSCST